MHPILTDKKRIAIYLVIWGVIGLLSGFILTSVSGTGILFTALFALPVMLIYAEMNLSAWFICRAFPIEKTSIGRVLLAVAVSTVTISALWSFAAWLWLTAIESYFSVKIFPYETARIAAGIFAVGSQIFIISLALSYLLVAFEHSRNAERRAYELRLLAQSAELKALRMQIDPHFLFNSLNSISALTVHDSEAARSMTMTLADFFRKSLLFGAKDGITLKEELSLLNHYLDIEKIRFGKRLHVEQNIDNAALNCLIPPLLLQPLLENAIKHGIADALEGGTIHISAQRKSNRLFLAMENPIDPDSSKKHGTGLGMDIVRKRLQTAFGDEGDIKTFVNEKNFQVVLFLPVKEQQ